MQIAICDDEKSIGLILEEKIKKLLPDAVIETYLSGDELIADRKSTRLNSSHSSQSRMPSSA